MIAYFAPLAMLAALVACSSPEEMEQALQVDAKASASSATGKGSAREVKVANNQYEFEYSYPLAAGSIRGLKAYLDADLEYAQNDIAGQAKEAMGDAGEYNYPYHPYSLIIGWEVVADVPGWLSLSRDLWTYTGGAHGNSGTSGLLWDKAEDEALAPIELFTSGEALEAAMQDTYCTALNDLRAERRGEPVDEGIFGECPNLGELTLLLGSSNNAAFDQLVLIADPYVAGSFAEGPYEVTVPVDEAILASVKASHRGAFSLTP